MPVSFPVLAEGNALVERDVVADSGCFADDHAHAVIDEEAVPDLSAGMDLDAGDQARRLRQCPCGKAPAMQPEPMMKAETPQRMQPGVKQHDLEGRLRRRIALHHGGNVFAYRGKHNQTSWVTSASDSSRSC